MRKAVGRIALLLGIAVVAAMAWYGASALFADDPDDGNPGTECVAGTKAEARMAKRTFLRDFGNQDWLVDVDLSNGRGGDWGLTVTQEDFTAVFGLPDCVDAVPVAYQTERPRRGR